MQYFNIFFHEILQKKIFFFIFSANHELSSQGSLEVTFDVPRCIGKDQKSVNFLEHVQLTLDMTYSRRGAIDIELISPNGKVNEDICNALVMSISHGLHKEQMYFSFIEKVRKVKF